MSEQERLISTGPDYGAMTSSNAEEDLETLLETVASDVDKINVGTRILEKYSKQLGGPQDDEELRNKINNSQQSLNACVAATSQRLQRLSALVRRGQKPQKLMVERTAQGVKETLANYTKVLKQMSEKMQAHMPKVRQTRPSGDLVDLTNEEDEEATMIANQQAQARLVQFETSMLLEREANIRKIEEDVVGVNQIMQDLSVMINAQGQTIDTVESQIEGAGSNVELGREELQKAARYQQSYRKKLFILIIIGVIAAIILITVIVKSVK